MVDAEEFLLLLRMAKRATASAINEIPPDAIAIWSEMLNAGKVSLFLSSRRVCGCSCHRLATLGLLISSRGISKSLAKMGSS